MTETSRRKKVMIVDDSEIVLAVAQYALQLAGYDVVTHPRPAGCLALVLQESPDLLLIDVNMPGLNGDTVVKMLGSTQSNGEMIVLLHSSLADDVLAQKAAAAHAHGYICKSDSPQNLVRQVSGWLRPSAPSGTHGVARNSLNVGDRVSEPRVAVSGRVASSEYRAGRLLLVDHEMSELAGLRRLVISHSGQVEFALSGKEALRRLQGANPPDVVILGRLVGSPNRDQVLSDAVRLDPRWKTRFVTISDANTDAQRPGLAATHVPRPVTEAALRDAIQRCLASADRGARPQVEILGTIRES
jgi:CheY-like chemotaxis protein